MQNNLDHVIVITIKGCILANTRPNDPVNIARATMFLDQNEKYQAMMEESSVYRLISVCGEVSSDPYWKDKEYKDCEWAFTYSNYN